jgi:hypothetical protein
MIPVGPDSSRASEAEQFVTALRDVCGRPVEGRRIFEHQPGTELLHADPTTGSELFPDGYGSVSVDVPLPGYDTANARIVVMQHPESSPGRPLLENTTIVRVTDGQLVLRSRTEERCDEAYDPYGYGPRIPVRITPTVCEQRVIEGDEADVLLGWVRTLKPQPRPEPISLLSLVALGEQVVDVGDDAVGQVEAIQMGVESFATVVENKVRTADPEVRYGGNGNQYLKVKPRDEVRELTGASDMTLLTGEDVFDADGKCIPKPYVILESGSCSPDDTITVYEDDGSVYAQRGPRATDPVHFRPVVGGAVMFDVVCPGTPGLSPVKLNPLQVEGIVAMVEGAEPVSVIASFGQNVIGSWSELDG